ncbi:MAG: hypothetical protein FRX49_07470 [Trebouxia sp. A1-2]|nr:MAG: hypothetical protein FRX49_07470 [Trebouxia sp. A1-2]
MGHNLHEGSSKKFLDKVLQDWAKWHAITFQTEFANNGHFESGRYEYAPATIAAEDITVLVDKPELQKVQTKIAANFNLQYETANDVPKYDRATDTVLLPVRFDRAGELKEPDLFPKAERRCHNCGSYAHTVQGCPHEKNPNEIRERARERGSGGRSAKPNTARYYDDPAITTNSAAGNTDELAGLKPGQLSIETRAALALGPLDPPPWLDRMRQLGYPPMYKYDTRTDAELFIFDDQTGSAGPKAAAKGTPVASEKPHFEHGQETVLFPGVNALMPAGADYALWGEPLSRLPSAAGSKRNQPEHPTQQDVAPPPLKRIRAEDATPQSFAFNCRQPGHALAAIKSDEGAADQAPFIFSAGTSTVKLDTGQSHPLGPNEGVAQTLEQQSWQSRHNPYAHSQQHVASPPGGLPPPPASFLNPYAVSQPQNHSFSFSAAGSSYSAPVHDTYAHLSHDPSRVQNLPQHWHASSGVDLSLSGSIHNREGSSAQGLSSIHSSMPALPPSYFGFATPSYPVLPQHATAAPQGVSSSQPAPACLSGTHQPSASAASDYGTYPPLPHSGMHPSYAAFAAQSVHVHANVARLAAADQAVSRPQEAAAPLPHPYAFQYAAPYQHAQSASANMTDTSSDVPPPPPLYPPPFPPC